MRTKTLFIIFLILLTSILQLEAQTNPDLYDMPTAENVLKNIKGTNAIDTYAKQRAALYVLWDIAMSEMEKDYMYSNKPIKKVISDQKEEYNNAMRLVYEKYLAEINQPETKEVEDRWHKLWADYKFHTLNFKEDLIANLFNERAKKRYYELNGYPEIGIVDFSNAEAVYQAGKKYFYGEDVKQSLETAFKYYKKAAEMGHPDGQYALGYMYATGSYIKQDYEEALTWFRKAEMQENIKALVYLGYLYQNGLGLEKDNIKAFQYYKKAADKNNGTGQFNLGWMYTNGAGVEKNDAEALKYFNLAAENNDADAQYQLGYMYENASGVPKDLKKAFEYYLKAANQGYAKAQYNVGIFYANGLSFAKDISKAVEWWLKAADQNNVEALNVLGTLYFGVNYNKALEYFNKAIELDPKNPTYFYNIGVMLQDKKNYVEAIQYYKKALMINPLYENANNNMAALILSDEIEIIEEMNVLGTTKAEDLKYNELKKKREELYKTAIPYLLKVVEANGASKLNAINTLISVYEVLGDTENAAKMKRFLD